MYIYRVSTFNMGITHGDFGDRISNVTGIFFIKPY